MEMSKLETISQQQFDVQTSNTLWFKNLIINQR